MEKKNILNIPTLIKALYENNLAIHKATETDFERKCNERTKLIKQLIRYFKEEAREIINEATMLNEIKKAKKSDVVFTCEVCGYNAFVGKERQEDVLIVAQAHKKGHHKIWL